MSFDVCDGHQCLYCGFTSIGLYLLYGVTLVGGWRLLLLVISCVTLNFTISDKTC